MSLNYVIDTNIIMGFLISGKASYKPLIRTYNFILPDFGLIEIDKYQHLIFEKTKQERQQVRDFSYFLFSEITVFPNYIIDKDVLKQAIELIKNIDIKDVAFTAFSIQLNIPLITRDAKLAKGLKKKGYKNVVLDQIRTIDKQRIVKTLDTLIEKEIKELKLIIKEMFVD